VGNVYAPPHRLLEVVDSSDFMVQNPGSEEIFFTIVSPKRSYENVRPTAELYWLATPTLLLVVDRPITMLPTLALMELRIGTRTATAFFLLRAATRLLIFQTQELWNFHRSS
jgi:hypothetical protein